MEFNRKQRETRESKNNDMKKKWYDSIFSGLTKRTLLYCRKQRDNGHNDFRSLCIILSASGPDLETWLIITSLNDMVALYFYFGFA